MKERFFDLLKQAETAAFTDGDFRRASELCVDAENLALHHQDDDLADRAFCNRCAYLIELDEAGAHVPRLQRIILGSTVPWNRWMATYNTSIFYFLEDDLERAQSYAERASSLAIGFDDTVPLARSTFHEGTLALKRAEFDKAEAAYEEALAAHRKLDGYHRIYESLAKESLGYVMLCTDRLGEGLRLCEESLHELEERGGGFILHEVLQDLCYGNILDGNLKDAEGFGNRAMEMAQAQSDALVVKNCLFLLAEIAVRRGDTFRARRYLRELTEHYPEVGVSEEIIDVFLATDLTAVVNLRG